MSTATHPETVAVPTAVAQVLGEVRSWSSEAGSGPATAVDRAAWLAGLRQLADATEAVFTQVLASFDAQGDGETLQAARSTASWLRCALKLAPADAVQRVGVARNSHDLLERPVAALAAGEITFDQVRAIHQSTRRLPAACRADAVELLTDLAVTTDVAAVRVAGRRIQHVVDPDGAVAGAEARFDRRYLTMSPLLDGMTAVDGLLDAEAATALTAALAPSLVPAGPQDQRSAAQRRADGLTDLALSVTAGGATPTPARLNVLVPLDALVGGGRTPPASVPEAPGGAAWLTPVALSRLACDASVARVPVGPGAVPLELGRSHRLFTPGQRQLLSLRDGGCRFPGCDRLPRHTDAHHLHPWQHGGTTDPANGLLLCRWHHRHVHELGWAITADDPGRGAHGSLVFSGPNGWRATSDPRGP